MTSIYISYRQEDSSAKEARHIHRHMQSVFGVPSVHISGETNDILAIQERIKGCDVLLVVIGLYWLEVVDERGRRLLTDPADPVVVEIKAALDNEVRIVPVLVDGVRMPVVIQLPKPIEDLTLYEPVEMPKDIAFEKELPFLAEVVEREAKRKRVADKAPSAPAVLLFLGLIASVVLIAGAVVWLSLSPEDDSGRLRNIIQTPVTSNPVTPPMPTFTPTPAATLSPTPRSLQAINTGNAIVLEPVTTLEPWAVNDAVLSDDGVYVAVASPAGIWLYDTTQPGIAPVLIQADLVNMTSLAFHPDGDLLAAGDQGGAVHLLNLDDGTLLDSQGSGGQIHDLAFSPDGDWLAVGGGDGQLWLWDMADRSQVRPLAGHTGSTRAVAFSPDGQRLASGGSMNWLMLWDVETGEPIMELSGHNGTVTDVDFSPDGELLVSSSFDDTIRLWNAETGRQRALIDDQKSDVYTVAFSPDSAQIASAGADMQIRLWRTASQQPLSSLSGHDTTVIHVDFSDDGTLMTVSEDDTIRLWDAAEFNQLEVFGDTRILDIAYAPDDQWLAYTNDNGTVHIWDTWNNHMTHILDAGPDAGIPRQLTIALDSQWLGTLGIDNTIRLWDTQTWELDQTLTFEDESVSAITLGSSDFLAIGFNTGQVRVTDVVSGLSVDLDGERSVNALAFSPSGRFLAVGASNGDIQLWNMLTGRSVATLTGHSGSISRLVFLEDLNVLLSGSFDNTVRQWELTGNNDGRVLTTLVSDVLGMAVSPLDPVLAVTTGSEISLWDARSNLHLSTTVFDSAGYEAVAFSADGRFLAVVDNQATITLWGTYRP